ncbi:MAG: hypothetical protein M1409_00910 [Actinobacteria bacterium]|nr:hypothetical protein [Actinomycetota bacterium]
MKTIPPFLQKYFWDVDFSKIDKKTHAQFIIERILEFGDVNSVKWMKNNFDLDEIKKVIINSKNLSKKSANFWQIIFNLERDKILCLKKLSPEKQEMIWKY